MKVDLPEEAATLELARRLAGALPGDTRGWTMLLQGELGAGKSTFARALLRAFGHEGPVPSPTYTLIEPYDVHGRRVYHVDLYRIGSEEELRYLGWTELDDGLRLVEWPERAPGILKAADFDIRLDYAGAGRRATLRAGSERARAALGQLTGEASATD